MTDIHFQLSLWEFNKIGCSRATPSSSHGDDEAAAITNRPFSFNIAQLGEVGGCSHFELPDASKTFGTSSKYYSALADIHLKQLSFQRNDAIESAVDCRKKYIARY